jgi:hypothetical protein
MDNVPSFCKKEKNMNRSEINNYLDAEQIVQE